MSAALICIMFSLNHESTKISFAMKTKNTLSLAKILKALEFLTPKNSPTKAVLQEWQDFHFFL